MVGPSLTIVTAPDGTRRRDRGQDGQRPRMRRDEDGRVNCYLTFGMDLWFIFAENQLRMIFEDLLRIVRRAGMGCAACVCLFGVSEFSARAQKKEYMPDIQGVLRGKVEYQPEMGSGRFEVRNARLSLSGKVPLRSEYKLEVDLCDEYSIKMKDAWVRIRPVGNLRLTIGQQRMPFTIDAHRNPSAQFFANRSFIAKQVGNMRDVGFQIGYDFTGKDGRTILSVDAGIFNGELLENQKSAWFKTPAYSARIQFHPVKWLSLVPSIQHQMIADRQASSPPSTSGRLPGWATFTWRRNSCTRATTRRLSQTAMRSTRWPSGASAWARKAAFWKASPICADMTGCRTTPPARAASSRTPTASRPDSLS